MAMNQKLLRPRASGEFYKSLRVDLQAYWRLDETAVSGNVSALDSIGTNNLTSTNSVLSTTGLIGTARNFVAASLQNLSIADGAVAQFGDGNWCISLWLYATTATGNNERIVSRSTANAGLQDQRVFFRPGGASSIRFFSYYTDGSAANVVDSSNPVTANAWNFMALSHNSGVVTIQLNGTRTTANRAAGKAFRTTVGPLLYFGGEGSGAAGAISGKLDEICKWTRALSNTELDALYNAGAGINLNK